MSKINKLTLSNFKFFGKEETIELNGNHLLLYGENGSGKSSIYWALYTLFSNNNYYDLKKLNALDKQFSESKLFILNPSAHYQSLSCPLFKSELEKAFLLFESIAGLPQINRTLKISKDSYLFSINEYLGGIKISDLIVKSIKV